MKLKERFGKYVRKSALVMYILFFLSVIIHTICRFSKTFSDFINMHVAKYVRILLAKITGIILSRLPKYCFFRSLLYLRQL